MAKWALVSDFDGTACLQDVGDAIVRTFGGRGAWAEVDAAISRGEINTREAYEIIYGRMRLSAPDLLELVLGYRLDPDFKTAVHLFTQRNLPAIILSDGFDFYIDPLLTREGLQELQRRANHLEIDGTAAKLGFPYHGKLECFRCANCKTYHLLNLKDKGYQIAYLGDGHTDRCAAQSSDLVFAKGYLARYLQRKGHPFYPFERYSDVLPQLAALAASAEDEEPGAVCASAK